MGRPPILDKTLIHKIARKIDKPDLSVVKSISALASRKNIYPEVALIITAKRHQIGSASIFKKLSPQQHMQLNMELNDKRREQNISGDSRLRKKIIKLMPDITEFADPYLQNSLYSNIPSEGYSIMFVLENSIRSFVTRILYDVFGKAWWNQMQNKKSLKEIVSKVSERRTKESENWYHSKRGVHEIYYTDYTELLKIIRAFDSIFSKLFKKGAERNLVGKLEELGPTRNVVAHNNPITPKDLERLKVHARDWFAYMQHLNK